MNGAHPGRAKPYDPGLAPPASWNPLHQVPVGPLQAPGPCGDTAAAVNVIMEDGDGEGRVMEIEAASDDNQCIDLTNDDPKSDNNDTSMCMDGIDESKQEKCNLSVANESANRNATSPSKIVFKGFKKRILAQTQENQSATSRNSSQESQSQSTNVPTKNLKDKRSETKRGKITEYAQYLGLQPAAKYKCLKCHSSSSFCSMSMLKQHQRTCTPAMAPMQGVLGTSESSSSLPLASNFRITRKVYLCSACGTYFENWNLFLHMREVHKRHICLFCLGMFGQAERLSYHLSSKHSVPETGFSSVEDFYNAFKGSCYLICCSCEKVFSETDNFYNHFCSAPQKQSATKVCSLCRQTGSHAATCMLALENRTINASQSSNSPQSGTQLTPETTLSTYTSKGIPKRMMRNNRPKQSQVSIMAGGCHQKVPNMHTKKLNARTLLPTKQEDNVDTFSHLTRGSEGQGELLRDTVSETIMEVSRCLDAAEGIDAEEKEEDTRPAETSTSKSPRKISEDFYDTVTQTILEVSRCADEPNEETLEENEPSAASVSKRKGYRRSRDSIELNSTEVSNSTEVPNTNVELDTRLSSASPKQQEQQVERQAEQQAEEEEREEPKKEGTPPPKDACSDSGSQVSSSPMTSPVAPSLFSPPHEPQALGVKEQEPGEDTEHTENTENTGNTENTENIENAESTEDTEHNEHQPLVEPPESQTSVSFNTVTTTDRSLVIKICTNRNSKFTVTTANANANNSESHDTSRESEENNNGEGSTSEEKTSHVSERERDSASSYQLNDVDSDSDSDKLAVVDSNVEETEEHNQDDKANDRETEKPIHVEENKTSETDGIVLAGDDVPSIELNVDGILEGMEIEALLKNCIAAASPTCVYCNHARQIAVNGKQLGLHMLAEHRFEPQHPAIIINREQFTARVKKSLDDVNAYYFNWDSYNSTNGTYNIANARTYECFHCRFHSNVHKELYLHNRKMHQKTILICIMCKSTFYSYSELLCHLCPGIYSPNINVKYRCCLCPVGSLPSAFRLMVHLRKRHHACDVCLEGTGNQQRLSNHVWKHKLHHLCYRCGIAYRNKPDITKHLFWKHGTESVLCKKCLQKKWPHVYHFCIPPTAFVCEECGASFCRAVALKVHKRLHSGDLPYSCTDCTEQFISKKLLSKHERTHEEPITVDIDVTGDDEQHPPVDEDKSEKEKSVATDNVGESLETTKDGKDNVKKVVDVYDLPPLNLSSESDSDSEDEKNEPAKEAEQPAKENPEPKGEETVAMDCDPPVQAEAGKAEIEEDEEEKKEEEKIIDGIWENFKSYAASLEMQESAAKISKGSESDVEIARSIVLSDHDYCLPSEKETEPSAGEDGVTKEDNGTLGAEHDYTGRPPRSSSTVQNAGCENEVNKKKVKTPRKKKQSGSTSSSDSSSDSDSSSCSCGTNCSCSSSSSGSSSSSSSSSDSDSTASEGSPRKQSSRKDRRKDKDSTRRNKSNSVEPDTKTTAPSQIENGENPPEASNPVNPPEVPLRESDLETDETETDEDFYDEHPQQLANKLLAEKRNQLMLLAAVAPASAESSVSAPLNNGSVDADELNHSSVPASASMENIPQPRKKVKTKKRKKSDKGKQRNNTPTVESIKLNIPKSFYQNKPGFASSPALITVVPGRSSTPNLTAPVMEASPIPGKESQTPKSTHRNVGSGSETDNKRSSKRKRVPKRFYGDSSDEEGEKQQPVLKWRKVEPQPFVPTPIVKPLPPQPIFTAESLPYGAAGEQPETPALAMSASESEGPAESSSDSSDSETEVRQQPPPPPPPPLLPTSYPHPTNAPSLERSDNLYCYCQCPYDEVSEMIACDGDDCRIEWFHFECVDIMVPPKGKWYCPDCRKRHGVLNSEDYFD